jgi:hypothetical protein
MHARPRYRLKGTFALEGDIEWRADALLLIELGREGTTLSQECGEPWTRECGECQWAR